MSYPAYSPFSIDPIRDLTRIGRGGIPAIREETPLFCKAGHTLLGTGLGFTVGELDDVEPVFGESHPLTDGSVAELEECKAALEQIEPTFAAAGEGEDHKAIDPVTLLMIQMLGKVLLEWIQKRRQGS